MEKEIIILMEKNRETGEFVKEIESYDVDYVELVKGLYAYKDDKEKYHVCITLSTDRDLQDWEYTAFYDYIDMEPLKELYEEYEELDEEYNPCFRFIMEYDEEDMEQQINCLINTFVQQQNKAYDEIKELEEEYR